MRRSLASLLVVLLSFPLIAAAFLANPDSSLPACCRANGKHHCAMADRGSAAESSGAPSWKAIQSKCPLYPGTLGVRTFSGASLHSRGLRAGKLHLVRLTVARPAENRPRLVSRGSICKRGPPFLSPAA